MVDIRKIIIIFIIATLFSILVFAIIDAIYLTPKYEDFCNGPGMYAPSVPEKLGGSRTCNSTAATIKEQQNCSESHGNIEYTYDEYGCPATYVCNTCNYVFNQANDKFNQFRFYISGVLALIAIFIGLFLPYKANTLNEWIGTGLMLGGTFALFFGTASAYNSLDRFVKPVVILAELMLVIFVAYRKVQNLKEDTKTN